MSWVSQFKSFTNDDVRQVQFFMLCRHSGIILSSVILARFLPVESVGTIEMLMLCGYLMTFFWSDALTRGYLAKKRELDNASATSFLWLYFLLSIISMGVLLAGQALLVPLMTSRVKLEGLSLFAIYQMLIISVWIAPLIGLIKGQNILMISFYVLIGPAFAIWTGMTYLSGITGALLGLFFYALVGSIWTFSKTSMMVKLNLPHVFRIIWPATWPLVLYAISTGFAKSFDAWLVARNFDNESFAIFRYGAREFPLVVALSAGLSTMMISKLHLPGSNEELKYRSTRLMHLCYPVVALFMLGSPLFFEYVFGLPYKSSALIFNIYLLLALTQLFFPQSILIARGDTKLLWYISLSELTVNIVASILLMRSMGLIGIVWGTLIAYVFEKIILMIVAYRRYHINPSGILNVSVLSSYTILLFISFMVARWVFGI